MSIADSLPKLTFSAAVKQVVGASAPPEMRQKAARGQLKLAAQDFLAVLLVLCSGHDPELKRQAIQTLRKLSAEKLAKLAANPDLHPRLLDFLLRGRMSETVLLEALLENVNLPGSSVAHLARQQESALLAVLIASRWVTNEEIRAILQENPAAEPLLGELPAADADAEEIVEDLPVIEEIEDANEPETNGDVEEVEEENLTKYQMAMSMGVSDKIKMALTGDKEWRSLLYKDANKLVNSAVLKNPRISEGEVLGIAKNRAASDEHIRLITLNRNWVKNPEVQKALVVHPRTPLPKALRYMNVMNVKELKNLAKSKSVSQVIANNARRLLMAKEKKS